MFLAAAALLASAGMRAADSASPVAVMNLRDGRVLHNVKVINDEASSIVLRADEGLFKIAKSDLPASDAAAYSAKAPAPTEKEFVMQRFDPNQAPEAPPPEPGAKPVVKPGAKPAPAGKPETGGAFRGCTIASFQAKAFQNVLGCAEVVIRNDSDETTLIRPGDIVCMAADGSRHPGRNLVADTFPPSVRKREVVPAHGEVDAIVTFTNEALDISSVQWSK